MKKSVFAFLALGLLSQVSSGSESIDNNVYVRLYQEWVNMDRADVNRMKALEVQAQRDFARAQQLLPNNNISQEEYEELQTRLRLATLSVARQEIRVNEALARLDIVKSRAAAGLVDIPICGRPSDHFN